MATVSEQKQTAYLALATVSNAWVDIDAWLADHTPETWQQIRVIDDWLYAYRVDDRVGIEQYQRQCDRLRQLYEQMPDGWSIDA